QHPHGKQLGKTILTEAHQYLHTMAADEHQFLLGQLKDLAQNEPYFEVLAEQLNQATDAKVANDALNLIHRWTLIQQHESQPGASILDVVKTESFPAEWLEACAAIQMGAHTAQRRVVIREAFKLYEMRWFGGCVPLLYAQLEG